MTSSSSSSLSSSAFDKMRKGDRAALRALLMVHGARVDAALAALGTADDDAWRAAALAMWRESAGLVRRPGEAVVDDGRIALAVALASAGVARLAASPLDKNVAARLAARVAAGAAPSSERALHESQKREDAAVAALALALEEAASSASAAPPGPGRTERVWPSLEPLLR